ncbi:MAG: FUSC family protein [Parashewanella sp.]
MFKFFGQSSRIVIGTATAAIISQWLGLSSAYLSVISCYVLMKAYGEDIHTKSLERVLGATFAVSIVGLIVVLGFEHQWLQIMLYVMWIFILAYYSSIHDRHYAMLIASVILGVALATQVTRTAEKALLNSEIWMLDVLIGAGVAIVVKGEFWELFKHVSQDSKVCEKIKHKVSWLTVKKHIFVWDKTACINAVQLLLVFGVIFAVNDIMNWQDYNVQAIVAASVISSQLSLIKSHQTLSYRLAGVVFGTLIAFITLHYLSQQTLFVSMLVWLFVFSCIAEQWQQYRYILIQAGIMLIVLLAVPNNDTAVAPTNYAWYRALGSFEGGIICILFIIIRQSLLLQDLDE